MCGSTGSIQTVHVLLTKVKGCHVGARCAVTVVVTWEDYHISCLLPTKINVRLDTNVERFSKVVVKGNYLQSFGCD